MELSETVGFEKMKMTLRYYNSYVNTYKMKVTASHRLELHFALCILQLS